MNTLYDEKCLELARYFYPDMHEKRLGELAALIQVTVEDFAPYEVTTNYGSEADSIEPQQS